MYKGASVVRERNTHNDVQHSRELRKQQHLMPLLEQSVQQAVQQQHLSTGIDQVFIHDQLVGLFVRRPVEQEWMG